MSLNINQKKVVLCLQHCIAIACPGSGKTRVLAYKAEHILRVDPNAKIVITTFTRDSAADIRKRIIAVAGKGSAHKVASSTFHSIALDQLTKAGFNYTIIKEHQVKQYIERALKACKIDSIKLDVAIAVIEKCRLNPDFEPANDDVGRLFISYMQMLEKNNAIDFSGILYTAVKMMRNGTLLPKACSHLFCDESQDMDELQYAWCAEHIKAGAILTMVGDDDQSIYAFRNSLGLEGMLRFQKKYGAELIMLDTNYRCHEEILSAAEKVIINNSNRLDKNLTAYRGVGGTVEAWHCYDAVNEANLVVRKIKEACKDNDNLNPEKYSIGVNEGEWAVLARNTHNLHVLSMQMVAIGIPFTSKEKDPWAEKPICFAIGLLSSLLSGERAGFDAAIYFSGIEQHVLSRCDEIYDHEYEMFLYCAREIHLKEFGQELAARLVKFTQMVQFWESELSKGRENHVIRGVFDWFLELLNIRNIQEEGNKNQNDIKLLMSARKIFSDMEGSLLQRLRRVTIKYDNEKKNGNKIHGVFLGTIHASKGLEFRYVWMLQADDGVIPDIKQMSQAAHEEDRRLFFVGITRARDCLYISCTKKPSSFVSETGIIIRSVFDIA